MIRTLVVAAALVGTAALAAPASAAPLASGAATVATAKDGSPLVQNVQYRRYGYGYGYGPGPRYYGGYRRGPAIGAGIAAGVIGGALAAGALAAPPPPVYYAPPPAPVYGIEDVDAVAYCSRRFRSYNPETGTYIGAGGVVRYCP
ncbi:BA14K family protein [Bosea sp. BH3]|uniref:BA14K family protein n=1 Tax=Bosea sp. BH3 TaxID=2871701 RepID=UPI0021CB955B|nr:BA14K family protein [Bosea sp. BH3]MCU4180064.1 BA14K family protein [Bosea sp. BH3]